MKERKRRCAKRRARDVERNWKLRKIDSGPETLFMAHGPCAYPLAWNSPARANFPEHNSAIA